MTMFMTPCHGTDWHGSACATQRSNRGGDQTAPRRTERFTAAMRRIPLLPDQRPDHAERYRSHDDQRLHVRPEGDCQQRIDCHEREQECATQVAKACLLFLLFTAKIVRER